ncbi:MAG: SDR family oxidoreductase [Candidatus Schekmanbacteria bacterium]|nr:SDR family oxidoreductase [Candidatus Schekmanbacteria bacterium]
MELVANRTAVVTGAGRGIGRAIAVRLAANGAVVTVNDVDEQPARETVEIISAQGGKAEPAVGSVTDPSFTDAMLSQAAARTGSVDILVNNAGITRDRVIHRMTDEDWSFVLAVNLTGTFNCIRSASPHMRDTARRELEELGEVRYHRKIINFYSTAAIRGNPGQANYTAAKMGNVGLTRTIAAEWARFRINVNAVAPGFTDTRLTQPREEQADGLGIPKAQRERMIATLPFGRPASPDDVAAVVLFFASPLSDFVTGQEINVSGGHQIP